MPDEKQETAPETDEKPIPAMDEVGEDHDETGDPVIANEWGDEI